MTSVRFEMRVPDDLMQRVDAARGHESRASFMKRALESALKPEVYPSEVYPSEAERQAVRAAVLAGAKSVRVEVESLRPKKAPRATGDLPKIAPRRWAK